jgi:hypothetical protein
MENKLIILVIFCLFSVMVAPASAFTAESLLINVSENGDAMVTFSYSLGWAEKVAVFFHIADPAAELKHALESNSGKEVSQSEVTPDSASFLVHGYAQINTGDGEVTYTTPSLSFARAAEILSGYWFAPLISVDFSPEETTVIFPDRYEEKFMNKIEIPSVSHTLSIS